MPAKPLHVPAPELQPWVARVFERAGVAADEAAIAADVLVTTSLRGVDSHGVIYVAYYVDDLLDGHINPRPELRIEPTGPATLVVHGDHGLGIVAGARAMREVIRRAREVGLAAAGVRDSRHFGAAAYYSMLASAEGMIGLATTNSYPTMPPWGSRRALLGNNPLSIAAPGGIEGGVVLDMATTKVAWGKLDLAARAGRKIPFGWAVDGEGNPTDDPKQGMQGQLLPAGDYKGVGLTVMMEILSAALAGGDFGYRARDTRDLGQFFMAIDVRRFAPLEDFRARVEDLAHEFHACEPVEGGAGRVYLPGEIEADNAARRRRDGIPLTADIVADLTRIGQRVGAPFPFGTP